MKFKLILSAICAFSALSVQTAQAQFTDTYSCDRCDEAGAIALARSKAPALNCSLNTAPGQIPTIEDQICTATQKTLIVANPQTRLAFKFNVHSEPDGAYQQMVTVNPVALNPVEQELLATFYNLHQEFGQAVQSFSSQDQSSSLANWESISAFKPVQEQAFTASSAACESHPSSYLANARKQEELAKTMAAQIMRDMNGQTWESYTTSTRVNGGGLNVSKDGFGLSISLQHNINKFYVHKVWDENNMFTFEATYQGISDHNGQKTLKLNFEIQKGTSSIDGMQLAHWFGPRIDLKNVPISNCMVEYIKSIEQYSSVIGGSGPTPPGRQPGGSAGAGGLCNHNVTAYACTPWSCREQTFITLRPCS